MNKIFIQSENSILLLIDKFFPAVHKKIKLARGDDCAIFGTCTDLCVSSDMFMEDVHFRLNYFSASQIGYKALAVNLSDLAGMGAAPFAFSLCLGLPKWVTQDWLDDFFSGMSALANKFGLTLCGGDISASEKIYISITIFGERQKNTRYLKRGQGKPGDVLFVAGDIGLARTGLDILEKNCQGKWPDSVKQHLCPVPKIKEGLVIAGLAQEYSGIGLMDISDGLAQDIPRLIGNGNGYQIEITEKNLHPEVLEYARKHNKTPFMEAFAGGEDYALLGSCTQNVFDEIMQALPDAWKLGHITANGKYICNEQDASKMSGFDHFKQINAAT